MADSHWSDLEQRALTAAELPSFPLNLTDIRSTVRELLSQVGRFGFFNEYTDHSFSHVEAMLKTADWLIPQESKDAMTPAEHMLLVLAIYFHDVGMLVSRDEYSSRHGNSDFGKFRAEPVVTAAQHDEFRARLAQHPEDEAERIWYEEFVRYTHGQRIRAWIEGLPTDHQDSSKEVRRTISGLFQKLDPALRRDLALLCESHTKDDIGDTSKFKLSQPYGDSPKEEANLQYLAAILRTVDLLQITKKRAPSVLYQVINPTDPLSQIEWRKQGAVRAVRPQAAVDKDGNASPDAQPEVIEVHAQFQDAEGFFGLTSYLVYAQREIESCHSAITKSSKKIVRPLSFPWRRIDTSGIEATGFLTESFGFSLDQQKILDLLTGHTLYNDTTVVLRELTQNALDAVRLQKSIESDQSSYNGEIEILWDSRLRELTIVDNGTGMSQEVIENHLLKVGSSRYQDPQFREKHPEFSSISRFGIGVLSAFMVSDDVEITTCSPDDDMARRIALRSVHGQYLIKLLDKIADRDRINVVPHGTSVRLRIRPTAAIGNILEIAKMWLMFPRCRVVVKIDDDPPQCIGYDSPQEAIRAYLAGNSTQQVGLNDEVDVREVSQDGVTLAFAVAKSRFFRDWNFLQIDSRRVRPGEIDRPPTALCIEGVGVEFVSPGFKDVTILAIANAVGRNAPKTNVARSALEDTAEQRGMLRTIYRLFARHITLEVDRLVEEEGFSLTRSVREVPYLASAFTGEGARLSRPAALEEAMSQVPLLITESPIHGRRKLSIAEIKEIGRFRTVSSPFASSVESFVSQVPTNISVTEMLKSLRLPPVVSGSEDVIPNFGASEYVAGLLERDFEVGEVFASESDRRIEAVWALQGSESKWIRTSTINTLVARSDRRFWTLVSHAIERTPRGRRGDIVFSVGEVKCAGLEDVCGFSLSRDTYLSPDEPISIFLSDIWRSRDPGEELIKSLSLYLIILETWFNGGYPHQKLDEPGVRRIFDTNLYQYFRPYLGTLSNFIEALQASKTEIFNPFAWDRRGNESFA